MRTVNWQSHTMLSRLTYRCGALAALFYGIVLVAVTNKMEIYSKMNKIR